MHDFDKILLKMDNRPHNLTGVVMPGHAYVKAPAGNKIQDRDNRGRKIS